ncbi:MAG: amidohydrolase family protein, partial [bacterium]
TEEGDMRLVKVICLVLLPALLFGCAPPQYDLGIVAGTLIDGTGAEPKHDVLILVNGNTIQAIRPKSELDSHRLRRLIAAADKYLIPGLFDMHGHVTMSHREAAINNGQIQRTVTFRRDVAEWMLRQLLAYGITTVRETGDILEEGLQLKADLIAGSIPGPRMFTCGPLIEGAPRLFLTLSTVVSSEEEARTEVRRQIEAGVDFLKIYASLPPDLAKIVVEEAHHNNIRVLAHLGATTWKQAVEMGMDGIVHSHNATPRDILTEDQLAKVKDLPSRQRSLVTYKLFDPAAEPAQELFQMMRIKKVANDPTIVVLRNYLADSTFLAEEQGEEMKAVPPYMMAGWKQVLPVTGPKSKAESERFLQEGIRNLMSFVKAEYEAGVPILAGSDFANPNTIPGLGLHQELELLVQAGIPPMAVLKMATHDAGEWLGILDEVGTVEEGKQADLVILDNDPLKNIRHTREIFSVIQAGQVIDRNGLLHSELAGQGR